MITRRHFLRTTASAAATIAGARSLAEPAPPAASFFLVGDTHYCADDADFTRMQPESADTNARLIDWLNRLPGTPITAEAGGGTVPTPQGVIHAGDLIDNGDKGPAKARMVDTELAAFLGDWGINGGDARLRWPVREVHGNHDGPRGDTPVVREIIARNRRRTGLTAVSDNGLHYSWEWGGVHFVALGIVVGDAPEVTRRRRYAPLGSLPFLQHDLATHVGTSGRPVVIVHHVDVHRYSVPEPDEKAMRAEWDYGDAHAYYRTLAPYRIAATLCGHTHVRRIVRWDGTRDERTPGGVPVLNTDNAAHYSGPAQAILHIEIGPRTLRVREFATRDAWQTGTWAPQSWTFPLPA